MFSEAVAEHPLGEGRRIERDTERRENNVHERTIRRPDSSDSTVASEWKSGFSKFFGSSSVWSYSNALPFVLDS